MSCWSGGFPSQPTTGKPCCKISLIVDTHGPLRTIKLVFALRGKKSCLTSLLKPQNVGHQIKLSDTTFFDRGCTWNVVILTTLHRCRQLQRMGLRTMHTSFSETVKVRGWEGRTMGTCGPALGEPGQRNRYERTMKGRCAVYRGTGFLQGNSTSDRNCEAMQRIQN
jgi:hypothetical protein